jgi:hypothetical protein
MRRAALLRLGLIWCLAALLVSGCASVRKFLGLPEESDPSIALRASEARWLLIKNPRFGDVPSEPEYIWVEEDKVPTTFKTIFMGTKSILAPPEIVARYGPPPGGGRISPKQGAAYEVSNPPTQHSDPGAVGARAPAPGGQAPAKAPQQPLRGYVVFIDTSRVVVDLTAADGAQNGRMVSVRRDKIPIVHPITGELLGELDEELAVGKVTEVREKFSVVEIQSVVPGAEIRVKDRVVLR